MYCLRYLANIVSLSLFLAFPSGSHATSIAYTAANVSDSVWQYEYSVTADTLVAEHGVMFYFDPALYRDVSVVDWPIGPAIMPYRPWVAVPANYLIFQLEGAAVVSDDVQGRFSVEFTWLGDGNPGEQLFYIVLPDTLRAVEYGHTTLSAVPVPSSIWLLGSGLLGLAGAARRRSKIV